MPGMTLVSQTGQSSCKWTDAQNAVGAKGCHRIFRSARPEQSAGTVVKSGIADGLNGQGSRRFAADLHIRQHHGTPAVAVDELRALQQ